MRPTSIDAAFEWDEKKRVANIRKHGVDFIAAKNIFSSFCLIRRAKRIGNEERWLATGTTKEGGALTVIYTWRREARRIISARMANRAERADLAAASKSSATPPRK
jgi:uncharacterized DUF497 family protein